MSDLEKIITNLTAVSNNLKNTAFPNWRKTCSKSLKLYTGTMYYKIDKEQKYILSQVCDSSIYFRDRVVEPLKNWLKQYDMMLKGNLAVTGKDGVDKFIRDGVNHTYNFIVVLNYFREFPDLFVSENKSGQKSPQEFIKNQKIAKEYKNILNVHLNQLLGCVDNLSTNLLPLSKKIKNPYIISTVESKIKYLDATCVNYRIEQLKSQ